MKKRSAKTVICVFFAVILLLTFFSRTIYRSLLPNVEVISPTGGTLAFRFSTTDYTLMGDNATVVYMKDELPAPLYVDRLFVRENDAVESGAPLLQFYEPSAREALVLIKQQRDAAEVKWRTWMAEYNLAVEEANAQVKKAETDADAQKALSQLTLLQEGIMKDTSMALVYAEYIGLCTRVNALTALEQAQWTLFAPHDGLVGKIALKSGDAYSGLKPVLSLFPTDSQPVICVVWKPFEQLHSTNWPVTATITDLHGKVDCTVLRIEKTAQDAATVTLEPVGNCDRSSISQVSLVMNTPYQPVLIANNALKNNECFLLAERTGAWGQKEYYAKRVALSLGASDGSNTVVNVGLKMGDTVIVASNTPIEDGQTVVIRQQ